MPPDHVRVTADWAPGRVGIASRIHDFAVNANAFAANVNTTNISDIVLVYLGAADLGPVDSQRIYAVARDRGGGSVVLSGRLTTTDTVTQYGRVFPRLLPAYTARPPHSHPVVWVPIAARLSRLRLSRIRAMSLL